MIEYKTQGSRVYAKGGGSYNCTNKVTAIELCKKLNNYEKELQQLRTFEKNFKEVSKQLKEVIMSLKILQDDMEKLKQKIDIME